MRGSAIVIRNNKFVNAGIIIGTCVILVSGIVVFKKRVIDAGSAEKQLKELEALLDEIRNPSQSERVQKHLKREQRRRS
ncbi:hypothetical protein FX738_08635 [Campylobacter jejuni]|nr:hypothetical protein [Campylobacter jejuni]